MKEQNEIVMGVTLNESKGKRIGGINVFKYFALTFSGRGGIKVKIKCMYECVCFKIPLEKRNSNYDNVGMLESSVVPSII